MKFVKFLAVFAAGFVCASVFFVVAVIPINSHDKFEFGFNTGFSRGLLSAANTLGSEFGVVDGQTHGKKLFSVKTTDVIMIEIDGIKTVRVIE